MRKDYHQEDLVYDMAFPIGLGGPQEVPPRQWRRPET